ncbi:MAG TPA: hypothetical protein VM841_04555, partial [Actinomycetota bacterium]|nr:hypothetical protein [Actinomycetota bacterium]
MKSRRGIFAALLVVVVAAPMHVLAGPEDDAMYILTVYDFAGQSTTVRAPYMTPVPVDSNFDGIYDRTVTVGGVPRTGSVLSANELRPVRSIVNPLWQAASDHVQSVLREGQRLTQHVPSWVWQAVPEVGELPAGVESLFIQSAPITPSNPHRAVTVGRFRPHGISVGIGVAAGFMQIGYEMSESYETFQIRAIRAHDPSGDTTTTVNIEAAGASAIGSIVLKTGFLTASTVDDARLTLGFAGAEQSRSASLTLRQAGSVTTATMRAPAQSVSAVLSRTTPGETFDFRITVPDFPDDVTFVHTPGAIRTLQVISPGISYMRVDGDIASSSDRSQLLAILRDLPPSVRVVISEAYGSALVQPESGSIGEVEVNLSRNEQLPAAPLSQYLPGISGRDYA